MAKLLSGTRIYGTATIDTQLLLNGNEQSSSTITGALRVIGGAGIGGNLHVGGDVVANRLIIQLTTITTTLVQTDDVIQTLNTSNATSTTTGALQVAGGAGIQRDVWIGGSLNVAQGITGSLTGSLTGNATSADKWTTARTVTFIGDTTGTFTIDGSANVSNVQLTIQPDSVALGTDTTGNYVATGATSGFGLSGSASSEGSTFTVTANSTSANTVSTIVFRDSSGNFSAGTITANLTGISSQVQTTAQTGNANYFPTFVDTNNPSATGESLFTTSSFVINPSTGRVGIGGTPTSRLHIQGTSVDDIVLDADHTNFNGRNARFPGRFVIGPAGAGYPGIYYNAVPTNAGGWNYIANNDIAARIDFGNSSRMSFSWATSNTSTSSITWSDLMVVTSGGNVGIGTTNPTARLELNGGTAMTSGWNRSLMLSATYPVLVWNSGNSRYSGIGVDSTVASAGMVFWVGGTSSDITGTGSEAMRIDSVTRNIGIGTSSPTTRLDVSGGARISGITTVTNTTQSTNTTTGALQVVGGVGIGGNVWIGGTLNVAGLVTGATSQVQTTAQTNNAIYYPTFVDSNNASATSEVVYTTSSFTVNPSTGKVDILGTGNATSTTTGALVVSGGIGIGRDVWIGGFTEILSTASVNSTITGALQVIGGIGVGGGGFFGGTVTATNFVGAFTGASTQVQTQAQTSSATHYLTFVDSNNNSAAGEIVYTTSSFVINPSTGNVSIGTLTSNARLQVNGSALIGTITAVGSSFSGPSVGILGGDATGGALRFYPNSSFNGDVAQIRGIPTSYGVSSAGAITFHTNSGAETSPSERMRLDASGNLGIGTTSISARLEVQSAAGVMARFKTGAAIDGRIEFAYNTTDVGYIAVPTSNIFEISARSNNALTLGSNQTERMRIFSNGNIAINTTTDSSFRLEVNGSFAATTKSFVINHPTKPGMKLRYGSLEGPENGVYVRGKLTGSNVIELPDYWMKLVDPYSITVHLTPIDRHQNLYVEDIVNNTVIVGNSNLLNKKINCYYTVFAERADVEKLQVEI